jgi:hypothetical protein
MKVKARGAWPTRSPATIRVVPRGFPFEVLGGGDREGRSGRARGARPHRRRARLDRRDRDDVPVGLGVDDPGARGHDPRARRLLRADLVDQLPQRHGAGVPGAVRRRRPSAGRAFARRPRQGLPAPDRLRDQGARLRVVRSDAGPRGAHRLRPDGVRRHGQGLRRRSRHGRADRDLAHESARRPGRVPSLDHRPRLLRARLAGDHRRVHRVGPGRGRAHRGPRSRARGAGAAGGHDPGSVPPGLGDQRDVPGRRADRARPGDPAGGDAGRRRWLPRRRRVDHPSRAASR